MSNSYRPDWAPDEVDLERPSVARMYDYYLGGSHNFAADRALAEQAIRTWPHAREFALANRDFLRRSVRMLAGLGIDQFLDLGSGIPTASNVHEVARTANPDARTAYVDSDAVAYAHGTSLLADQPHATFVHADLRDPAAVLGNPELTGFLDLSRPVAVLMFLVLPFVPESDDPASVIRAYRDATVPGSYIAVSHGTGDYRPEAVAKVSHIYENASHSMTLRSRAQIAGLLSGYELLEPGVTDVISWHPDADAQPDPLGGDVALYSMYGAVGRRG
ncbi:MAG TPA: SAM-dependent methyltransferase [Actinocrinis sp.]|nr:SAM-dependent methyltransferase [Actinocrinis sp.]